MKPFWEHAYQDPDADAFGPFAEELAELVPRLPAGARVLDLGCGDGRNAVPLARAGFEVHAIDKSKAGIERLQNRAAEWGVSIAARILDLADYSPDEAYDLIITHGVLHLLKPQHCSRLVTDIQAATRREGWNVHVVFTDRLPQPPDLKPYVRCAFREGELRELYARWEIEQFRSYTLEDDHPGGIHHRHAVNMIVARRLTGGARSNEG